MKTPKVFNKITTGFVIQRFEEVDGKVICTDQEFIAGDDVTFEDLDGQVLDPDTEVPEVYQPFTMILP